MGMEFIPNHDGIYNFSKMTDLARFVFYIEI